MTVQTDGFSTTIEFASDPSVLFVEREVTPPGLNGGGAIETSTMANTRYRTKAPKSLLDVDDCSLTVVYDPATLTEIKALAQVNDEITITFPDGSTWVFWGWLETFVPSAQVEGEQPTAEITIMVSNTNDSGVETGPAYTAPA